MRAEYTEEWIRVPGFFRSNPDLPLVADNLLSWLLRRVRQEYHNPRFA